MIPLCVTLPYIPGNRKQFIIFNDVIRIKFIYVFTELNVNSNYGKLILTVIRHTVVIDIYLGYSTTVNFTGVFIMVVLKVKQS